MVKLRMNRKKQQRLPHDYIKIPIPMLTGIHHANLTDIQALELLSGRTREQLLSRDATTLAGCPKALSPTRRLSSPAILGIPNSFARDVTKDHENSTVSRDNHCYLVAHSPMKNAKAESLWDGDPVTKSRQPVGNVPWRHPETAVSNHCQSTRPPLITQPFSPSMRHSMPSHTSLPVSSTMVSMVTDMDSLTPAQNKTPTQQFTHTTSGGVTLTDPPLENLPPLQNGLSSTVNPAAANLSDIARRQPTPGYPRAAATDMVTPLHSYESRDESDQKSCSLREPSLQASHSGFCGDFGIELEALKRQIDEMQQEHQRERETWQRREHEQQLREQAMQEQISRTQDQLERAIAHLQVNKSHGAPPPPGMRPSDPVDPHHRMYRETRGSRTDRSHDRGHGRSRSFDAPSSRRRRSKAYVNEAATDVGTQPDATDHHQTSSFPRSMRSSFHGHMPPATESYYPMPPPAPYLSSSYVPGRSKSSEETRKARQHKGRSPQSFPRRRTRGQMYNRSVNDYHSAVEDASEDDFSEHNDEADEARLLYNQYYRHPARSTHPPSAFYQQRSSSPPTYSQERPHRMYHEPSLPPERLFRDNGSWRSMPPELAASLDWPMHFPPSHLYGLPFAVAINGAAVNGDIPDGPIENPADPRYWNLPPQRQTSSQAHVSIY